MMSSKLSCKRTDLVCFALRPEHIILKKQDIILSHDLQEQHIVWWPRDEIAGLLKSGKTSGK